MNHDGDATAHAETPEHEPSEITYDEQFYPARPRFLRPRVRLRPGGAASAAEQRSGEPDGANPTYVAWLERESMLHDAQVVARQVAGSGSMWQNPYANPDPRAAIETASVWFTAYPISLITRLGQSYLATLADPALWEAFQEIGIRGVHTGPVKRAGGLDGWTPTPSIDGHFDRISTQIDETFGTEEDFRHICEVAGTYGGTVIDDIVPGHTGKGPDFRLAEMKVGDYPGIYHMVEIPPEDWHLLPDVKPGRDSANLDVAAESALADAGYIVGALQRVIFQDHGVKDTNWSATAEVLGPDGEVRRWVYLHYFKEGQPSINWLDPSFAGMRMVIGDAVHSLSDLGTGALRLDANGFLGVEKSADGLPAWSEGHPLSEAANHLIASMVRKLGGFTFQELNLSIDDIQETSKAGADLSYDFVNRPAYHHALATGDTEFLRLTLNEALRLGVPPERLVHALQNHDEMTYELVHFATEHAEEPYEYAGETVLGADLAVRVRQDLIDRLSGDAAPYNAIFTTNGISSTTATIVTASLGITSLEDLGDDDVERVKQAHLLLAMFNAMQPGVFALSGWDLCGSLTLERNLIEPLLRTGDSRWIHRSAYDLMGYGGTSSLSGIPRGRAIYGSLPDQLRDPGSFASRLRSLLALREELGIATAEQLDVPAVSHRGLLVMVHRLPSEQLQLTVLNFSPEPVTGFVRSEHLVPGTRVVDAGTRDLVGEVDDLHGLAVTLEAHAGAVLVVLAEDD